MSRKLTHDDLVSLRLASCIRTKLEEKASKAYVPVSTLDPNLAKEMPATLPPGSTIIVKVDRKDYKILFNWTLCGAVSIAKPEMVDPVRTKINTIGCPYFGLWTDGAAKW